MKPLVTFICWQEYLREPMKKRVGRPGIDPAFRIRTKAWFNAVSQASGGMTAGQLEILFGTSRKNQKYAPGARPGLWGKYETGYICPKFKPDIHGRPSIVERVEEKFPGTAKWMTMPFWNVLSRKPMEMSEIKQIYLSLPDEICEMIVAGETDPPRRLAAFWRRPTDWRKLYDEVYEIGNLDAATAILALIKEYETSQRYYEHMYGAAYWGKIALFLHQYPPLSPLIPDINKIIGDYYSDVFYPIECGDYSGIDSDILSHALAGKSF